MFGKHNVSKGFTLAELLVVVAIIGVLVAVSIPIFSAQKAKAILATNQANARAAKAAAVTAYLENSNVKMVKYTISDGGNTITTSDPTFYGQTLPDNDISSWTVDKLGKKVIDTWYVYFNDDGSIKYFTCYYKEFSG